MAKANPYANNQRPVNSAYADDGFEKNFADPEFDDSDFIDEEPDFFPMNSDDIPF